MVPPYLLPAAKSPHWPALSSYFNFNTFLALKASNNTSFLTCQVPTYSPLLPTSFFQSVSYYFSVSLHHEHTVISLIQHFIFIAISPHSTIVLTNTSSCLKFYCLFCFFPLQWFDPFLHFAFYHFVFYSSFRITLISSIMNSLLRFLTIAIFCFCLSSNSTSFRLLVS